MGPAEMEQIAEFMARVLVEQQPPQTVLADVVAFREPYQTLYYCFDAGLPPATREPAGLTARA
jgi:glycine hydroxymethyltransferase